jgi:hypothetical protein
MFPITPYGMGMPQGNQNLFNSGSGAKPMGFTPSGFGSNMGGGVLPGFNLYGQNNSNGLANLFGNGDGFLGSSLPTKDLQLGIGGLQTLGNLWGGFKSLGLANKQFDFSKMIAEKNLTNSTQSYNTALSDKINSRAESEMSTQAKEAYLAKNSLK